MNSVLALESGKVFFGRGLGALTQACGELIFNTAMTGYQEILTDPSYRKQIVLLTYPHIGNTGINTADYESSSMQAEALVLRDYPRVYSNYRANTSLDAFLRAEGKGAICDIDTRALTRLLRNDGAQNACLRTFEHDDGASEASEALAAARACPSLEGTDLAHDAGCNQAYKSDQSDWCLDTGGYRQGSAAGVCVAVIDYGVKNNIIRLLNARGARVTVLPASSDIKAVEASGAQAVVLANGPGDPQSCDYAISLARQLLEARIPVLGICLGHQILGLAMGAHSEKMKFGHHGANHPVLEIATGKVFISSQNHGFCISREQLPEHIEITHRSLFDNSIQGLRSSAYPAIAFQGHPEASPGPMEMQQLFDDFMALTSA